MDKIEELKKLLWILDSKHNVSMPQTKENIDFTAGEIIKLFCQPAVSGSLPLFKCKCGYETSNIVAWGVHADCCNGNDR